LGHDDSPGYGKEDVSIHGDEGGVLDEREQPKAIYHDGI
jgi:hypothetical protein